MTDLRQTSAGLVLGEELGGRCLIHDAEHQLVVEMQKPHGQRVELGLAAGKYEVHCGVLHLKPYVTAALGLYDSGYQVGFSLS